MVYQFLTVHRQNKMSRIMRKESLWHKWTAKVQSSLHIRAVSPEPMLFGHVSGKPKGNFRQRTRRGLAKGQRMRTERLISQKVRKAFFSRHGTNHSNRNEKMKKKKKTKKKNVPSEKNVCEGIWQYLEKKKKNALSYDSNQPAHPRSLIRVFVFRIKKFCILC